VTLPSTMVRFAPGVEFYPKGHECKDFPMAEFDTILARNSRGADITSTVLCESIIEFQFEFDFGRRQSYIKGLFQNFHGPVLWDDAYRALRQRFLDMKDSHDPKKKGRGR